MAAMKRKKQKATVNPLEVFCCNYSVIFIAGFMLGFGMTTLMFVQHYKKSAGLLKNQMSADRSAHSLCVKIKIHSYIVAVGLRIFLS